MKNKPTSTFRLFTDYNLGLTRSLLTVKPFTIIHNLLFIVTFLMFCKKTTGQRRKNCFILTLKVVCWRDSTQLHACTLLEMDHDWKQSWVIEIKCSFYQGSKDTRYTGALVVVMGQKHWADRGGDSNIKKTNNNGREAEKMCFLSGWSCVCVWWRKLTEREWRTIFWLNYSSF